MGVLSYFRFFRLVKVSSYKVSLDFGVGGIEEYRRGYFWMGGIKGRDIL